MLYSDQILPLFVRIGYLTSGLRFMSAGCGRCDYCWNDAMLIAYEMRNKIINKQWTSCGVG